MEKFSLKWNDFQTNVAKSFQQLRHEEEISDVTLIGDDYQPILAHKVVLSSCSDYFKKVFYKSGTKHSTPVLCMVGLSHDDLKNVLDYIYNGEVQIYQEDLESFLTIAERLKLDGLLDHGEPDPKAEKDRKFFDSKDPVDVYDLMSTKTKTEHQEENKIVIQSDINTLNTQELNEKLNELFTENLPGEYICNYCPKVVRGVKNKSHMREHVQKHIDGLQFNCTFCDKTYRQRGNLKTHISREHKISKN